jgi:molecular chaperone DnaK
LKTIGIDLGTTNTVTAVNGESVGITQEQGSAVLPSVVAFPPNGTTLVGTPARRRRAIDGRNTIFSAKRLIGRGWHSPEANQVRERYPFDMVQTDDGTPAFKTRAGVFTPLDIGQKILEHVLQEVNCDLATTHAAVAVPSAFTAEAREATLQAASGAGLSDIEIIDEPIATAMAYMRRIKDKLERVAVYDLGGGTFELAVVDCRSTPFKVLANKGDLYLGGDDIDRAIALWAAEEMLKSHRWDLRDNPLVFDRLVVECERAKIRLCYATQTEIELAQVDPAVPGGESTIMIGKERLADLADFLVRRTFVLCDEVLSLANIKASEIDAVFLAGGTTQLPMVREAVSQYFDKQPRSEYDPMEVVGIGASLLSKGSQ